MNPGTMRHRITLYQPTDGVDAMGSPTFGHSMAAEVWARVQNGTANETDVDPRRVAQQSVTFSIYESATVRGVNPKWEIEWDGRRWNVESVMRDDTPRMLGRYLHISAKSRMEDV